MVRGVRWYLVASVVLGSLAVLAGCGGTWFFAEREPWRHDAEVACLTSGALKEGAGKIRVEAISGPGACGADFPIKVSVLGEGAPLAFGDEVRPPAIVPNGAMPQRWPDAEPRPSSEESPQAYPPPAVEARPLGPPAGTRPYESRAHTDEPISLDPRGRAAQAPHDFRRPYPAVNAPWRSDPPLAAPRQSAPALGPPRAPPVAAGPVSVAPAATLACPLVSALDRWVAGSVQPAALRWFGQPVVEIRQISAYSCRGMNGNPNAHISEHAFGNALDIAAFTLADGRKVTVKNGWLGAPEEQGFLRDVQGSACGQFTTVLAPGADAYHYDHIHVDLMRRSDGRRACNPNAVSGAEVAARARARYVGRRGEVTGSVARPASAAQRGAPFYSDERTRRALPVAVPGEDGED